MRYRELGLFDSGEGIGVKGIAPDLSPETLPSGWLSFGQNVRFEKGSLRVRRGISLVQPTPLPVVGGELCGAGIFADGESSHIAVAACFDQMVDKTRLFVNQHTSLGWGGWIEATAESGQWGDTRISGRPPRGASFAGIPGLYGVDRVAVFTGLSDERPRMIRLSLPTSAPRAEPLEPPLWAAADSPVASVAGSLDVAGGSWSFASSGGLTSSAFQTAPNQGLRFVSSGGALAGAWASALLPLGSAIDASSSPQLLVMAESSDGLEGWKSLKVEAASGGAPGWVTLYDGSEGKEEIVQSDLCFESGDADFRIYAFPLSDRAGSLTQMRGLRLTTLGEVPAGFEIKVLMVSASGKVPGGAQYGVSVYSPATGVESPGVAMLSAELADSINQDLMTRALLAGLPAGRTSSQPRRLPGVLRELAGSEVNPALPLDEALFYQMMAPIAAPTAAQAAKGGEVVRVYRRDPGEAEFTLAGEWPTARWNGSSWVPGGGFGPGSSLSQWGERALAPDRAARFDKDSGVRMPDGFCTAVPCGKSGVYANGRLYAASTQGSQGGLAGSVWISEEGQPLRFRETARFQQGLLDESGGGVVVLSTDPIETLIEQSGSILGQGAVLAWSQRAVYRIEGLRGAKLVEEGCLSSASVAALSDGVGWLTRGRQAALMTPGFFEPSRGFVAGEFLGMTEAQAERASVYGDRRLLLVAYSSGDQVENLRVAVYDQLEKRWESLDRLPEGLGAAYWTRWKDGPAFWTKDGRLARWEDPEAETDAGSPILISLRSRSILGPAGGFVRLRRAGVSGSGGSGSLAIRRIFQGPASVAQGVISLEGERTHRFDRGPEGEPMGGRGESAQVEISGAPPAGWTLYRWTVEAQMLGQGSRESG